MFKPARIFVSIYKANTTEVQKASCIRALGLNVSMKELEPGYVHKHSDWRHVVKTSLHPRRVTQAKIS